MSKSMVVKAKSRADSIKKLTKQLKEIEEITETENLIIEHQVTGPVDANCYLIYGDKSKEAHCSMLVVQLILC